MTEIIDVPDARSNADLRSEVNSLRQVVKQLASLAGILHVRIGRIEEARIQEASPGSLHRVGMVCAESDRCIHCTPDEA